MQVGKDSFPPQSRSSSPGTVRPDDLPRSATGRIPQWVLEEAATGRSGQPEPWRTHPSTVPTRAPRRTGSACGSGGRRPRLRGILVALIVSAAASVGLGLAVGAADPMGVLDAGHGWGQLENAAEPPNGSRTPLGVPMALAKTGDSYRFLGHQADGVTPVAWDPCRAIHYVVQPAGSPAGGAEIISEAMARVSAVTGLQFVDDGVAAAGASDSAGTTRPPVLVRWATVAQTPALAGDTIGEATTSALPSRDGPTVYVTGSVDLDAEDMATVLDIPGGRSFARAVVLHELGHLVGLDHVDDPSQIMNPESTPEVTDYGTSDLTGLAALGRGECVPGR